MLRDRQLANETHTSYLWDRDDLRATKKPRHKARVQDGRQVKVGLLPGCLLPVLLSHQTCVNKVRP